MPHSIAQSRDTLYVTGISWNSIRTVNTTTAQVATIVTGTRVGDYADGPGTSARFNYPGGIVVTDDDTLYVADSGNDRIRKVFVGSEAKDTEVSTLAGNGKNDKVIEGRGTDAQFNSPAGLAVSGTMLYVADSKNHRIRAINLASPRKTVSTIAGDGTPDYRNGAGSTAQFNKPIGLAVSGTTLYVADSDNHRIRAINLASSEKTVSTIAGDGTPNYRDGAGSTAQFNIPIGLAVSGTTLYVTDMNNHRIRAVALASPEKTVSTIAGNGKAESTNGIGTAARFNLPIGIAVSGSTLYVASEGLIRKLEYR